jgi:hypothetical protein
MSLIYFCQNKEIRLKLDLVKELLSDYVVSFVPRSLYPRAKSHRYPLDKKLSVPQSRPGRCGRDRNLPLPGFEPGHPVHNPSLYRLRLCSGPTGFAFRQVHRFLSSPLLTDWRWGSPPNLVMGIHLTDQFPKN